MNRRGSALYVIEDAHWIDEVSELMLADFLTVIRQTRSMMLITYRPEYQGALAAIPGAQTIALRPLNNTQTVALIGELLGTDASVRGLAEVISDRAGGNPFFAEVVRDLAERGSIRGARGSYLLPWRGRRHHRTADFARRDRRPHRPPELPRPNAHSAPPRSSDQGWARTW